MGEQAAKRGRCTAPQAIPLSEDEDDGVETSGRITWTANSLETWHRILGPDMSEMYALPPPHRLTAQSPAWVAGGR